jgi:hypothetical protein
MNIYLPSIPIDSFENLITFELLDDSYRNASELKVDVCVPKFKF